MTRSRDFDRLARAWLDLMPDEAPDRVIADVLQAVEGTSQLRPPLGAAFRRSLNMNRFSYAAIAAAIVVVLVGGAVILTRSPGPGVGGPSPSASAVRSAGPSLAPSGAQIPIALQHTWIGAARSIAGLGSGVGLSIAFDATTFQLAQSNQTGHPLLAASAAVDQAGRFRLTATLGACAIGNVGTYTYTVSASGRQLTITAITDQCAARQTAISGSWFLNGCKRTDELCLGDMDAGTYGSQYFRPLLNPGEAWVPKYGGLIYTTPAGWATASDWPGYFRLTPSASYANENQDGPPDGVANEIFVGSQPGAFLPDPNCVREPTADTTKGRTVASLVAYLKALPALQARSVTDLTVDGHPAKALDIALKPSDTATCPGFAAPDASYLAGTPSGWGLDLYGQERSRVILVDAGGGDVLVIAIRSSDPTTFDQLVQSAMPIVASFHFT
jgi:hypothetical protein